MPSNSLLAIVWEPELADQTINTAAALARQHDGYLDVVALG